MKRKLKYDPNKVWLIVYILALIIPLGALVVVQKYVVPSMTYEKAITFNVDIPENTLLTNEYLIENIVVRDYLKSNVSQDVFKPVYFDDGTLDISLLVGYETKNFIPQGAPLHHSYFGDPKLVLNQSEGESVAAIPREYIISAPGSMRKKDEVLFYPVMVDKEILKAEQNQTESLNEDGISEVNKNVPLMDNYNVVPSGDPIGESVVYSIKDGQNREVLSTKGEGSTGNIASIEVVNRDNLMGVLADYYNKGYKFIICYR